MKNYEYNLNEIKETLTIDQIFEVLLELHGDPIKQNDNIIVSKTICHHSIDDLNDAGYKLYYYNNTHLFRCYTGCSEPTFDIFELVRKVKEREYGEQFQLPQAIRYVA